MTCFTLTGWRNRTVNLTVSVFAARGVLIDTGFSRASGDVRAILETTRPRGVFITHRHEDHAGNAELVAGSGVPLVLPPATTAALRAPGRIAFYRRFTWGSPPPLRSPVTHFEAPGFELRPAPGHSDDHHVVWDNETGTLFAADLFLGVRVRVAHPYEDPRRTLESVRAAIVWGPDRMFDGHRGLIPRPRAALAAKAAWMEETFGRIDELTDAGRTARDIVNLVSPGFDRIGVMSRGEYSRLNFVRAVQRTRQVQPERAGATRSQTG